MHELKNEGVDTPLTLAAVAQAYLVDVAAFQITHEAFSVSATQAPAQSVNWLLNTMKTWPVRVHAVGSMVFAKQHDVLTHVGLITHQSIVGETEDVKLVLWPLTQSVAFDLDWPTLGMAPPRLGSNRRYGCVSLHEEETQTSFSLQAITELGASRMRKAVGPFVPATLIEAFWSSAEKRQLAEDLADQERQQIAVADLLASV